MITSEMPASRFQKSGSTGRSATAERVVWSAECGGCLMLQQKRNGQWVDGSSFEEGQYPEHDACAKKAAKAASAYLRINKLTHRATMLEARAAVIRQRAHNVAKEAGLSDPIGASDRYNPSGRY